LNVPGKIVFKNVENMTLSEAENSNSSIAAIELLNDGDGHFAVIKHDNKIRLASVICVCGENVKGKDSHSCAWTGAGNGISKVYDIKWQAYTATSGKMPGYDKEGYYYLTNDLKLTGQSDITVTSYLDLNGKTITCSDNTRNIALRTAGIAYSIADSKEGGTIKLSENYAYTAGYGGVVWYTAAATFNMYGGTIDLTNVLKAPTAPNNAGDEYHLIDISAGATFAVYGGEIKCAQNGDCIGARGNGKINVSGGTIYGEVVLRTATDSVTVGGNAKVGVPLTNASTSYGISAWEDNTQVMCKNLTENADIRIVSSKIKLVEAEDSSSALSAVTLMNNDDGHFAVVKHNNKLRIASVICVCGANVTGQESHSCAWTGAENGLSKVYDIKWQAHTATTGNMPGYNEAGYYYLTNDLKLTGQSDITVTSYLDLNGKTITCNDTSRNICLRAAGIAYSVADSKEGGTIKVSENYAYTAGYGGVIWYTAAATFNMYGGTIDMTNTPKAPTNPNNAGDEYHLIDISAAGTFAVCGGEIKPAQNGDCIGSRGNGKIIVSGGTIYGEVVLRNASDSITVGGDAKVGIPLTNVSTGYCISAWAANTPLNSVNVTSQAQIVISSPAAFKLSGTGAKEAFVLPSGYEVVDTSGQLSIQAK